MKPCRHYSNVQQRCGTSVQFIALHTSSFKCYGKCFQCFGHICFGSSSFKLFEGAVHGFISHRNVVSTVGERDEGAEGFDKFINERAGGHTVVFEDTESNNIIVLLR